MATAEQIGIRREAAMNRLTAAAKRITTDTGVELPDFPTTGKDPEQLRAQQIEWTADALEAVAGGGDVLPANVSTEVTKGGLPVVVTEPEPPDLSAMKRDELNLHAIDIGIDDPESYKTKAELIAAIEALPAGATETLPEDPDAPVGTEPTDEPPVLGEVHPGTTVEGDKP